MISNQTSPEGHAGFRETYERMKQKGELASFRFVTPTVTAAARGYSASLAELTEITREDCPDVILVASPHGFGHDPAWVDRFLKDSGDPVVLHWDGDVWHRWAKPITTSMGAWLSAADIVFTPARKPQTALLRQKGARQVRFMPHTYCHVVLADAERVNPVEQVDLYYDAVVIGNRLARWGRASRIPGAVQRASLVRKLQTTHDINVALYGAGWSGRGAQGVVPYREQTNAIRQGLMSVNWDHFPRHESYASDRLAVSLIAGRAHVTTAHPKFDWMPTEQIGLFLEPTVSAVIKRVRGLMTEPRDDVLTRGVAAHRWARERLSNREAARFMLGAVDRRFHAGLPEEPWLRLVREWPH